MDSDYSPRAPQSSTAQPDTPPALIAGVQEHPVVWSSYLVQLTAGSLTQRGSTTVRHREWPHAHHTAVCNRIIANQCTLLAYCHTRPYCSLQTG